jgi:hypothetical protein
MQDLTNELEQLFRFPNFQDMKASTREEIFQFLKDSNYTGLGVTQKFDFSSNKDHTNLAKAIANIAIDNELFIGLSEAQLVYVFVVINLVYEQGRTAGFCEAHVDMSANHSGLFEEFALRKLILKISHMPSFKVPAELISAIHKKHGKETGGKKGISQRGPAKAFIRKQLSIDPDLSLNEVAHRTVKDSILNKNKYGLELKHGTCKNYTREVKAEKSGLFMVKSSNSEGSNGTK